MEYMLKMNVNLFYCIIEMHAAFIKFYMLLVDEIQFEPALVSKTSVFA